MKVIKLGAYTPSERSGIHDDSAGLSPTLTTGNHGNHPAILIKNATSKGYLEAHDGDGVNISSRMDKGQRGNVQGGCSLTIKTQIDVGVAVYEEDRKNR